MNNEIEKHFVSIDEAIKEERKRLTLLLDKQIESCEKLSHTNKIFNKVNKILRSVRNEFAKERLREGEEE